MPYKPPCPVAATSASTSRAVRNRYTRDPSGRWAIASAVVRLRRWWLVTDHTKIDLRLMNERRQDSCGPLSLYSGFWSQTRATVRLNRRQKLVRHGTSSEISVSARDSVTSRTRL